MRQSFIQPKQQLVRWHLNGSVLFAKMSYANNMPYTGIFKRSEDPLKILISRVACDHFKKKKFRSFCSSKRIEKPALDRSIDKQNCNHFRSALTTHII